MEKEKVDILRRKMIGSGLAVLATAGVIGVVVPNKFGAKEQQCSGGKCASCNEGCYSCAVCSTCQMPSSKVEPQD